MSLKPILNALIELEHTPSINEKVELLKHYLNNKRFLQVITYALHGQYHYNIKQFPGKPKNCLLHKGDSEEIIISIFDHLNYLRKAKGANDTDKYQLYTLAEQIDEETVEVVKRIVNKDLRCGVSAKLINRARPGTILIMPYMRCSTVKKIKNIRYGAFAQEKADGMFDNTFINAKGKVKFLTRNGKKVYQLGKLKKLLKRIEERYSIVLTGELLIRKNGKILPRKTGNGILNQCIQGTADQSDADCAMMRVWDCIPEKDFWAGYSDIPYDVRLEEAYEIIKEINDDSISVVRTKHIKSFEEAQDFYAEIRKNGGEGAIIKNIDSPWKNHTSPNQIKMKNVIDVELRIVGWFNGKQGTKYAECMGSVQCTTECRKLEVSLGTGFSDKERNEDWDLKLNKICTAECESVIKSKSKKTYSLYLPRYGEIREDRDTADTLAEILSR